MALHARWMRYRLDFKFEARTSRSVMRHKDTYFVELTDDDLPGRRGIGECALFAGLSHEDDSVYESRLQTLCANPTQDAIGRCKDSSIRFGFETALHNLRGDWPKTAWSDGKTGIDINGLVWMGPKDEMRRRIAEKLAQGFSCIKLKIGGIDFDDELDLISHIRNEFPSELIELRVDANGAFAPDEALQKIERLSRYHIHSIEQPIRAGQFDAMARVCANSAIPVALDEELIGTTSYDFKSQMLSFVKPAYIILKPSLCGGLGDADSWISTAENLGIGWWATSALESNIGLEALGRWISAKNIQMPQGLGTGQIYSNNIEPTPLSMHDAQLWYEPAIKHTSPFNN